MEFCTGPEVFVTKPFASPEGRAILSMGNRALPLVIEEIRSGEPHWKWAAFHIVPFAPAPPHATWEDVVRTRNEELLERYSRDWVKWWDENRNTPERKGLEDDP